MFCDVRSSVIRLYDVTQGIGTEMTKHSVFALNFTLLSLKKFVHVPVWHASNFSLKCV